MKHYLVYHGPVNQAGISNLEILLAACVENNATDITVCICSGGGDVTAGIGAYNFMRMLPIPVKTYAFGMCGSIAATMFMAGAERISASVNFFSLHAASYIDGPKSGQISENTALISMPFQSVAGWENSVKEKYFGTTEEQRLTPEEALRLKIATKIEDLRFDPAGKVTMVKILNG